jgi:hypothetical protein
MRERFNDLASQAAEGYEVARKNAVRGMRSAYNTAQEYPGTIAAIVVGLGITAFLVWAVRRAGGWRNFQDNTAERVREGYDYVRDRAARIKREAPQIAE